ncbi:MAG: sulfite exporter TauE/SafE family protein [Pikeienuella sp.]
MPEALDLLGWAVVIVGALAAGFVSGFAGFGTGLVAAGFWYFALPAAMVPPLVAIASVAAQMVGMIHVRAAFDRGRAGPYLVAGALGVPLGVLALSLASPSALRVSVGLFLVAYPVFQLLAAGRFGVPSWGGRRADGAIGFLGGVLGGYAGLSGAPIVVWLQLRGGPSAGQRAVYQPFNLIVLALAGVVMAIGGQIDRATAAVGALIVPATLISAWIGARLYAGVGEAAFRRVVLALLMISGAALLIQTLFRA